MKKVERERRKERERTERGKGGAQKAAFCCLSPHAERESKRDESIDDNGETEYLNLEQLVRQDFHDRLD